MPTLKILHNLDNSNRGGIPEYILRLHRFSRHTHEFWAADGSMAEEMRAAGMSLWDGGPPEGNHYDVVIGHTVGGWSGHNLALWAHARDTKFVEDMHSICPSPTPPDDCDGWLAQSDRAVGVNGHMHHPTRIYSPIEVTAFTDTRGPAIGKLCRLVSEKCPSEFVEIARLFDQEAFLLAGDGSQFAELRARAPGNCYLTGWLRDFPDFYARLKLFVFPTRDECCCMSVAMAQAAGLPVICQDMPALRETTGGFAAFASSLPEFAAQVRAFLNDPAAFEGMAQAGHAWAMAQFDTSVTVTALDDYLEAL